MRHTSDAIKIDLVVIAILRYQDQIVVVQQHVTETNQSCWVLPGGLVESGEMMTDSLIREVKEEAPDGEVYNFELVQRGEVVNRLQRNRAW